MTVAAALEAAKGNQVESMARLITLCAEDGDGKRLFREAEYHDLMVETDPIAMARLAKAINEGTGLTAALVDAAEKN